VRPFPLRLVLICLVVLSACPPGPGSPDGGQCYEGATQASGAACTGLPGAPTATGAAEQLGVLPGDVLRVENVTYGVRGGLALQGDLYVPTTDGGTPGVLVVVHGGGWADCGRRRQVVADHAYVMALLGGFATYNVEYRLTSEGGGYPENVRDIKCAVQWLRESAPLRFGIDGARVAISGESAGAHLALMVGLTEDRSDLDPGCGSLPPEVDAVVAYSPPTDLPELKSATTFGGSLAVDPYAGPCAGVAVSGCTGARACDRCVDASPTAQVCGADDPVLLIQAPDPWDLLIPHAQAAKLHGLLTDAGFASTLVTPTPEQLGDAGCSPAPNQFAHGYVPCLTETTGQAVLDFLRPILSSP
jgi:acetyl esterase/lipase